MRLPTPLLRVVLATCLLALAAPPAAAGAAVAVLAPTTGVASAAGSGSSGDWRVSRSTRRVVLRAGQDDVRTALPAVRRPALRARATGEPGADLRVTYSGFTAAQRAAFQQAVDTWSGLVSSPVPIRIQATATRLPSNVLGAAGPVEQAVLDGPGADDTGVPIALANALAGRDLSPGAPDVEALFSSNTALWSYTATPQEGRYDFTTVVLHEIAHGLGFAGAMEAVQDASGVVRGTWDRGQRTPLPQAFDRLTVTRSADGTYRPLLELGRGSTALGSALTTGRAFWDGPAGRAANGGQRPELYTPSAWEDGSSYSHLDEDDFGPGDPDSLMTPALDRAEVVRDPGGIALGMLADLGWGSSSAPPRIAGPRVVDPGSRVDVTGAAPAGSTVRLWFRTRGSTTTDPGGQPGFRLLRTVRVGPTGRFTTTYLATDDRRYYAQVGARVSRPGLTQVRPTIAGAADRTARRGSTVRLTGRGLPSSTLRLRFVRSGASDVLRSVRTSAAGAWSASYRPDATRRVTATGVNAQSSRSVLLRVR